jgi:hypothetical protein
MVRLTAPILGMRASYEPSRRTIGVAASGDSTPGEFQSLTSRFADFQFGAYVAPLRLPRVDVQYDRQHHLGDAQVPEGTSTLRTLRAAQDFRLLSLHAGYSDQAEGQDGVRQFSSRTWSAGLDARAPASMRRSASLSYGFLRGERPRPGGWDGTDNHNVNADLSYRFTSRSWLNGGGFYRLSQVQSPQRLNLQDYDVYAYHNYAIGRAISTRVGGGAHTFQQQGRTNRAPYLLALFSADGRPRPRWRGRANFSHSTNWIENGGPSSIESFGLGSTFDVSRTFEAHVDGGASARSGPVILAPQRYSAVTSGGVRMQPLRSLSVGLDGSSQTNGGALLHPRFRARTGSANVSWQPSRGLTLTASQSVAGAFPYNQPRTHSTALSGTWRMSRAVQLDGNYSNSSVTGAATPIPQGGRETFGFRLAGALTRRLSTTIGYQESGRGEPGESRALDVTATYRFEL